MGKIPRPTLNLPARRTGRMPASFTWTRPQNTWKSFAQTFNQHVGQRLNLLRCYNGKTQTEMGELCGLTFQQIARYERGRAKMPPDKLWLIAAYFSIDIIYFFDGFDPNDVKPKPPITPMPPSNYPIIRLKIAAALDGVTSARKLHALTALIRAVADETDGE